MAIDKFQEKIQEIRFQREQIALKREALQLQKFNDSLLKQKDVEDKIEKIRKEYITKQNKVISGDGDVPKDLVDAIINNFSNKLKNEIMGNEQQHFSYDYSKHAPFVFPKESDFPYPFTLIALTYENARDIAKLVSQGVHIQTAFQILQKSHIFNLMLILAKKDPECEHAHLLGTINSYQAIADSKVHKSNFRKAVQGDSEAQKIRFTLDSIFNKSQKF